MKTNVFICVFILTLALMFGLSSGCDANDPPSNISLNKASPPSNQNTGRFTITSYGEFNAGYSGHDHEILEIHDNTTGKVYLGITGVGVTEEFISGKTTTEE